MNLHTPRGLVAADLWLAETARNHPCRDTRIGAQLILAHENVEVAEVAGDMLDISVGEYNRVCCGADERFVDVFTAAMVLWHNLLPAVGTAAGPCMVGNAAGQLWGGAEPAPPKTIQNLDGRTALKTRIRDENGPPPRPTLAAPRETEVDRRPPRPTIPAGAPISYRGLSIRLAQERGTW